uniref:EOG090X0AQE n=1 Tax=Alona affinis TaxID=381656 RepID=A0A9N6WQY0_9CRUS|nr:EOG090X0AQE [Alona affinis]
MQPDDLSPVHQSAVSSSSSHHSSLMQGQQNSYVVAQLPVTPAESHQQSSGMFPRSVSMPLPSGHNTGAAHQPSEDPSGSSGSQLLGSNSSEVKSATVAKIQDIKNWSISTYKCTKQLISEKLGKSSRTVDTELESQIELLRDVQHKYLNILRLSRALSSHFQHVVVTQQGLGEAFAELAQKSPELQSEFLCNAETQRSLSRHGEVLMAALNFFVSSVNTLVNKTMEDTLLTVKRYEAARIEYDAYRSDLEVLLQSSSQSSALSEAQQAHDQHKAEFEKLRADVSVKLRFLNENRVKVMHKQLLLFHNAVSAYFSGNEKALEATLKQFNIKMKTGNASTSSWLEQ